MDKTNWRYLTKPKRKFITVDSVMELNPCEEYTRERVEELFAGRKRVSAIAVLKADVTIDNKLWLLINGGLIAESALCMWALDCAQRVQHFWATKYPDDNRPQKAIDVARQYVRGETGDARDARDARDAARAAEQEWQIERLKEYIRKGVENVEFIQKPERSKSHE